MSEQLLKLLQGDPLPIIPESYLNPEVTAYLKKLHDYLRRLLTRFTQANIAASLGPSLDEFREDIQTLTTQVVTLQNVIAGCCEESSLGPPDDVAEQYEVALQCGASPVGVIVTRESDYVWKGFYGPVPESRFYVSLVWVGDGSWRLEYRAPFHEFSDPDCVAYLVDDYPIGTYTVDSVAESWVCQSCNSVNPEVTAWPPP